MLERRVGQLENDYREIKASLSLLQAGISALAQDIKDLRKQTQELALKVATVEGQLKSVPTALQLLVAVVATWASGAAIVVALIRVLAP